MNRTAERLVVRGPVKEPIICGDYILFSQKEFEFRCRDKDSGLGNKYTNYHLVVDTFMIDDELQQKPFLGFLERNLLSEAISRTGQTKIPMASVFEVSGVICVTASSTLSDASFCHDAARFVEDVFGFQSINTRDIHDRRYDANTFIEKLESKYKITREEIEQFCYSNKYLDYRVGGYVLVREVVREVQKRRKRNGGRCTVCKKFSSRCVEYSGKQFCSQDCKESYQEKVLCRERILKQLNESEMDRQLKALAIAKKAHAEIQALLKGPSPDRLQSLTEELKTLETSLK